MQEPYAAISCDRDAEQRMLANAEESANISAWFRQAKSPLCK